MSVFRSARRSILLAGAMLLAACGPRIIDVPYQGVTLHLWGPSVPDTSEANPFHVTQEFEVTLYFYEDAQGQRPYGTSLGTRPPGFEDFQPFVRERFSGSRFKSANNPPYRFPDDTPLPRLSESQDALFARAEVLGRDRDGQVVARARCPIVQLRLQSEAPGDLECHAFFGLIGRWNEIAPPNTPRHSFAAAALHDGRVVIAGGSRPNASPGSQTLDSVEVFDPATRVWTRVSELSRARSDLSSTVTSRGEVFFSGGRTSSTSFADDWEIFDPTENSLKRFSSPLDQSRAFHASAAFSGDRVLIVGGQGPDGSIRSTAEWLVANGTVSAVAGAGQRRRPCMVRVREGQLLVCSGVGPNSCASFEGNTFQPSGQLLVDRAEPRCAAVRVPGSTARNLVYVVGGARQHTEGRTIEVWENGNVTAFSGGDAPVPLIEHAVTVSNGKVIVAGGYLHSSSTPVDARPETFWIDPERNTLNVAANMNIGRARHRLVPLADGTVMAIGGQISQSDTRVPGAEIFVVPDGD